MKKIYLTVGLLMFSFNFSAIAGKSFSTLSVETIYTHKKIEPSGLAIRNNILYVISDNGRMQTFNLVSGETDKYKIRNKKGKKKKADYEGITFDFNGNMYLAIEGKDKIAKMSNDYMSVVSYIKINRKFKGKTVLKKGGNGIEAIAFWKREDGFDYFVISNQSKKTSGNDRSALLIVKSNGHKGEIISYYSSKTKDISALTFLNGNLVIVSDTENKLSIANLSDDGLLIKETYSLSGINQEGISFLGKYMYIAQDSGNILKIRIKK